MTRASQLGAADDSGDDEDDCKECEIIAEPNSSVEDLMVAHYLSATRGLPTQVRYEDVAPFLEQFGYGVTNEKNWSRSAAEQPQLSLTVEDHAHFGGHTQYEIKGELRNANSDRDDDPIVSWGTIRRLRHLREGLHDPVKTELGPRYPNFFSKTPFARHTGPTGTTDRLRGWMTSLAACVNTGSLSPCLVSVVLRLVDVPGTPIHPEIEKLPLTAAIFGGSPGGVLRNPAVLQHVRIHNRGDDPGGGDEVSGLSLRDAASPPAVSVAAPLAARPISTGPPASPHAAWG